MSKRAYVVPVAEHGFVKIDDDTNPVGYGLEDEDGRMIEVGGRNHWRTLEGALREAQRAGYRVDLEA